MKLRDVKISRQINLYFGAIFLIVLVLVVNSFLSVEALWKNTASLYNNPLTVRRAVGDTKVNVLLIHRDMSQLPFEHDQFAVEKLISNIGFYEASMNRQLEILYERYLGPQSDIDEVADAMAIWKTIRNETVRLVGEGQIDEVENRVKANGIGGSQADIILTHLAHISEFAMTKGDDLYQSAQEHRNRIVSQMIILCVGILGLLIIVAFFLRKGILPPLRKLIEATKALNQGKLDTRIHNDSPNELGELSQAFDNMSDSIQKEIENKEKAAIISSVMFKHDTLRPFCQEVLNQLQIMTDSQISAIYFIDDSKSRYECYESIGAKHDRLTTFYATSKEGEFGAALMSKKIQHIKDIPSDTQMIFSTVSGEFTMKEILTIPIVNESEIIAVISLASMKNYSLDSIELITSLVNEITASLNAVISSQKIFEFSQELQKTNTELEQQARELEMQADELTEQNTELEIQKRELDEANRLKTNFLSNMSHELRTPLNSVIALSGVLSRRLSEKIPEEECSYLEIIERNGKNLLTMINDILDISRIESGNEEIEISQFNTKDIIDELMAMIQLQAQQQHIELLHTSQDTNIVINTDVSKFRHILQNLISNAVKFTENGTVEIKTVQNGDWIEITVKDSGIGISKEHLPHIFDEFRQADGSTSRRFGGTGLGLAIAKKYATFLGGNITVKSTVDVGSEFTLLLPIHYDEQSEIVEQPRNSANTAGTIQYKHQNINDVSGKSILLVEDNESSIIQIKDLIEDIKGEVHVAHDAVEAFKIIDKAIPDAMVLDLMMPDIDGFKVLEMLRNAEATAHIPVLILTAKHITKEELKFLKRNNIHQLIQKGDVKRQELQHAVATMLYPDKTIDKQKTLQTIKGKPVVLLVEDNPDNMITEKALLGDQYVILEAVNAYEGINIAKKT